MADTARGNWPEVECDDCGKKGVIFQHWGPLVPPGAVGKFCGECLNLRAHAAEVEPLGYRKGQPVEVKE